MPPRMCVGGNITKLAPLTLSLSPWERGRPNSGCEPDTLSHGERAGVRGVTAVHYAVRLPPS